MVGKELILCLYIDYYNGYFRPCIRQCMAIIERVNGGTVTGSNYNRLESYFLVPKKCSNKTSPPHNQTTKQQLATGHFPSKISKVATQTLDQLGIWMANQSNAITNQTRNLSTSNLTL